MEENLNVVTDRDPGDEHVHSRALFMRDDGQGNWLITGALHQGASIKDRLIRKAQRKAMPVQFFDRSIKLPLPQNFLSSREGIYQCVGFNFDNTDDEYAGSLMKVTDPLKQEEGVTPLSIECPECHKQTRWPRFFAGGRQNPFCDQCGGKIGDG